MRVWNRRWSAADDAPPSTGQETNVYERGESARAAFFYPEPPRVVSVILALNIVAFLVSAVTGTSSATLETAYRSSHFFSPPLGLIPGSSGVASVTIFHDSPFSRIALKSIG